MIRFINKTRDETNLSLKKSSTWVLKNIFLKETTAFPKKHHIRVGRLPHKFILSIIP